MVGGLVYVLWLLYCFASGWVIGDIADHFGVSQGVAIVALLAFNLLIYFAVIAPLVFPRH